MVTEPFINSPVRIVPSFPSIFTIGWCGSVDTGGGTLDGMAVQPDKPAINARIEIARNRRIDTIESLHTMSPQHNRPAAGDTSANVHPRGIGCGSGVRLENMG